MFNHLSDLKKAGLFYVVVMSLSLVIVLLFRALAPRAEFVVLINTLTPLLAVVLMLLVFTRDGHRRAGWSALGLGQSGRRLWGLTLLLPLLVLGVSFGLTWLTRGATFALPTEAGGLPNLLISWLPKFLIVTVFALSEEIGFRGYLLPRLKDLGTNRALILSGFLFGTWHLPLIFLTPFYIGDGNRLLTVPIFLLLITAAGIIYGVMRLQSDSIWPSTILHGAFNSMLGIFEALTVMSTPFVIYLVGESGLLTLLATAAVALWLTRRRGSTVSLTPILEEA